MSGLKGAPKNRTKVAQRINNLDNTIQAMLAAKPATTTAAFNDRLAAIVALQARIDAEDAGVTLPPPELAKVTEGSKTPALDRLRAELDREDAGLGGRRYTRKTPRKAHKSRKSRKSRKAHKAHKTRRH